MPKYNATPNDQLTEGDYVQFFGVHVLKWEREIRHMRPDYAFIECEDEEGEKETECHREAKET
jgi:hypothetical protein